MTTPWVQTRDGHDVDLITPDLSAVTIEEAAHALARINRFAGHTRGPVPYSVAQHSVLVSEHVPPEHALAALCHDLHEAIIGDILSPVKRALALLGGTDALRHLDETMAQAMGWRFGFAPMAKGSIVQEADLRALVTERRDLLGDVQARPWGIGVKPWAETIEPWSVATSEREFLLAFRCLGGKP